jgi:hypothetical protein
VFTLPILDWPHPVTTCLLFQCARTLSDRIRQQMSLGTSPLPTKAGYGEHALENRLYGLTGETPPILE